MNASVYLNRPDDGYSCLCTKCGMGHSPVAHLVGRERELEWKECRVCKRNADAKTERNKNNQQPLWRSTGLK